MTYSAMKFKTKTSNGIGPFPAALLSVIPGIGQCACGSAGRGIFWMAATGFLAVVAMRTSGASAPLMLVAWAINIFDAATLAKKNRREKLASVSDESQEHAEEPSLETEKAKRSFVPDVLFLFAVCVGVGVIFAQREGHGSPVSVTVMWPIALALLIGISILTFVGGRIVRGRERRKLAKLARKAQAQKDQAQKDQDWRARAMAQGSSPSPEPTAPLHVSRTTLCGYCGVALPLANAPLERCPSCATRFRTRTQAHGPAPESFPSATYAQAPPPLRPGSVRPVPKDPALASVLSLVLPGSGQVYNGEMFKGLFVFATCWLIVPWLFGVLDAFVTAKRSNQMA